MIAEDVGCQKPQTYRDHETPEVHRGARAAGYGGARAAGYGRARAAGYGRARAAGGGRARAAGGGGLRPGEGQRATAECRMSSAAGLGDVEGLADRAPDDLRVDAVCQRLADRPAAEGGQRLILRHALGIHVTELRAHSFPEGSEAHRVRLPG